MNPASASPVVAVALLSGAAFIASVLFIIGLRPLLARYALARPNARSSHTIPTPQGGGMAVIAAVIGVIWASDMLALPGLDAWTLLAATILLACVGALDDLRPIPVLPRLILQIVALSMVLAALPADLHMWPAAPLWLERTLLLFAGLWFVNLVNFMDGLDWMTVAEILPIAVALGIFGLFGELQWNAMVIAAALGGAILGFALFNRPVAKLFLGDVGSLPVGLLTGWCLLQLAGQHHVVAALLLPLYYLADATVTLLRRLANREPVWIAHRSHFYQRATDNGFAVLQIVVRVFALNIFLAALAAASIFYASPTLNALAACAGVAAVGYILYCFTLPRTTNA